MDKRVLVLIRDVKALLRSRAPKGQCLFALQGVQNSIRHAYLEEGFEEEELDELGLTYWTNLAISQLESGEKRYAFRCLRVVGHIVEYTFDKP